MRLEKNSACRYSSAAFLAADLQRYLKGLPTFARPPAALARAVKWARRRPATAALIAVSCAAVLAGGIGLSTHNVRLCALTRQAQFSERRSQDLLFAADMTLAQQAYLNGDVGHMLGLLDRHRPTDGAHDPSEFAWQFLDNLLNRNTAVLPRHPGAVYGLAYSPSCEELATTCHDGRVRVFRLADRTLVHELKAHRGQAGPVRYSPDGLILATGGEDGRVVLYNAQSMEIRHELPIPEVGDVLFSHDGGSLFVASGRDVLQWDPGAGKLLQRKLHSGRYPIRAMSLTPDGSKLLTVGALRASGDRNLWI